MCHAALERGGRTLRCPQGHAFDIARQGYVNLSSHGAPTGDDAGMVAARDDFLRGGWFDPLSQALAQAAATDPVPGAVVELGAGTGHHLAQVMGRLGDDRDGVALDASVYAARRAARAHPRAASVVADAWDRLPLMDGCAAVVLVAFAPRAGNEIARVLAPGGTLVVATPAPHHLAELSEPLRLLAVDPDKDERLSRTLEPALRQVDARDLEWAMALNREAARALAAMGPSARHSPPGALADLTEPIAVTGAVTVSRWRRA